MQNATNLTNASSHNSCSFSSPSARAHHPQQLAATCSCSHKPMPWCALESATARIAPGVAKMLKIISPEAVVVSMPPSLRERNPTPLLFNYSTISIRFRSDLPSRSSRQTIRVSPSLRSLRQAFKPGRSVFEPLAWSV